MTVRAATKLMTRTKLLVADDDVFFQRVIEGVLAPVYDLVIVPDGMEAWHELQRSQAPRLAILDWVMPGLTGPQICRKVRATVHLSSTYLILLTARNNESDIISGLRAGADDYITKPPLPAELRARIKMGERVLALQDAVRAQLTRIDRTTGIDVLLPDPQVSRSFAPHEKISTVTANHEYSRVSNVENQGLIPQRETQREGRHSKH